MTPTYYGDSVRVRTELADDLALQDYEVVEVKTNDGWVERARFGHMSDDLAFTHAREHAQALAIQRVGRH